MLSNISMIKIIKICCSALFVLLLLNGHGQLSKMDSLQLWLKEHPAQDTNRVKAYIQLIVEFVDKDSDTAIQMSREVISLASQLDYNYGLMRAHNSLGYYYWYKGNFDSALVNYQKALYYGGQEEKFPYRLNVLNNIGVLYKNFGNPDSSIVFYRKSLELAEKYKDEEAIAKNLTDLGAAFSTSNKLDLAIDYFMRAREYVDKKQDDKNAVPLCINLGVLYAKIGEFEKALQNYRKALQLNETVGNRDFELMTYNNIGYLYYHVKQDYDSGVYYLNKSSKLAQELGVMESYLSTNINLGNIFLARGEYEKALQAYLNVYNTEGLAERKYEYSATLINLGLVYLSLGNFDKAEEFTEQGLRIAMNKGFLEFASYAYGNMVSIDSAQGEYLEALQYKDSTHAIRDSIWNQDVKNRIAEVEFEYELKQKDELNSLLQEKNQVQAELITRQRYLVIGAIIIIFLLVTLAFVIRHDQKKLKKLNKTLDDQKARLEKLNQTKDKFFSIIAHDLKNPFDALLGLLAELDEHYEEFDEKMKKEIISSLLQSSQTTFNLLINLLEWSRSQRGLLENKPEKNSLHNVAEAVLEFTFSRAKFKKQEVKNLIDEDLVVYADPQLLQGILINLVNNAIKFTPQQGKIEITAEITTKEVSVCVKDNGVGIDQEKQARLFRIDTDVHTKGTDNESGTGLGLIMVKEYVDLMGGKITIKSGPGKGSTFCFTLPV